MKEQVIKAFLAFLSRYVSLSDAVVATLGGDGHEAQIWSDAGITNDHGWLIERNRKRQAALITAHRYRVLNRLASFGQILKGKLGDQSVDGFHLDLCGTFRQETGRDIAPALRFIGKSRGRCLAVTVADQRRNIVLENWPALEAKARDVFGTASRDIFEKILSQQRRIPVPVKKLPSFMKPFDPEKAAKREFGLLVDLASLLVKEKIEGIAEVVRYIYVSRYSGKAFRMRSYFLHFADSGALLDPLQFARSWASSTLRFTNNGEFQELTATPTPTTERPMLKLSKLAELVKVLGGPEETEYLQLQADSAQLQKFRTLLGEAPPAELTPVNPRITPLVASPVGSQLTQLGKSSRAWDSLSEAEQTEWLLTALEARAAINDVARWRKQWPELLKKSFGRYSVKLGRRLRATMARTSGGFRAQFEMRIKSVLEPETARRQLERLAKLPNGAH